MTDEVREATEAETLEAVADAGSADASGTAEPAGMADQSEMAELAADAPPAEPEAEAEPASEPGPETEPETAPEPEPAAPPQAMSVGRMFADVVRRAGVRWAFTVPGESFLSACWRASRPSGSTSSPRGTRAPRRSWPRPTRN